LAGCSGALNSPGASQPGTAHFALAPSTRPCILDCFVAIEPVYIGSMNAQTTGPVAAEMLRRLNSALSPTRIKLVDDSEQHRGHGGYNPAGESHFTLTIESESFAGKNRVQRQRMIYAALGELMEHRVHALSIRAIAPGEQ
jgi:BolA protein